MRTLGAGAAAVGCLVLLAACGPTEDGGARPVRQSPSVKAAQAPAQLPVPRGEGSDLADDFNGDGHRDLVLNDLVKEQAHSDDAGIGIVYGGPGGLAPGARQLLSPARNAAPTDGQLPAVFDAEATCDLDADGFTDLVVSTDPPFDGQGRPPVPLQILFGSPQGPAGRAVPLVIPAVARAGNDWPDQPACGDFDGDGAHDLVVHASDRQLSFLRGPFTREGAPRAAGAPLPAPGNLPTGPVADVDRDGDDDLVVRSAEGPATATLVLGGPDGPAGTGTALPEGLDVALGRFGRGAALDAAVGGVAQTSLRYDLPDADPATLDLGGSLLDAADLDGDGLSELVSSGSGIRVLHGRTTGPDAEEPVTVRPAARGTARVLAAADFDGDDLADLVVRTYVGETEDTVAVYPGAKRGLVAGKPVVSFSTGDFLEG
ncbi:FG-GAP repeat domain-containing protein [Streptomyces sp. enrichment culture]|uniref:FG-GAP repeat domain-containing protein n=1 Tax=Streptomyces sp. enrichment culture TaxID=1795815 RepID=UPI003F5637D2